MAVDERRESFHVNRIAPSDLDERLLAQAYRHDLVAALQTLATKGAKPLATALDGPLTQGRTPEYGEDGAICLKTRNVIGGLIDSSSVDRVSRRFALENEGSCITNETVLMNRSGAGSIGRVSIYLGTERVFTNEELFRFRIAAPHDAAFVAVFFGTSLGERVLERGVNGSTGQLKLVQEHVESVPVLFPHPAAQRYIGDKVRQAERLRAQARSLRGLVNQSLDHVVPEYDRTVRVSSRVESAALQARLDCRPYRSHFRALEASIRKVRNNRLAELATSMSGDPVPSKEFTPIGIPLVRNRDIGPGGFWSTEIAVSSAYAEASSRYSAKAGLVLVAMDGEFRAQFALDLELPLHVNQRVAMIVTTRIRPELLTTWLNRPEGQHQLNRWAVKTTVEHTTLDHISNVLVPRLDEDEENALADQLLSARQADWYARSLTFTAQTLVEQLIDGRLIEADLVAAQTALDAGDRSADREILKALRQSDAPGAKPLIADVDGLYALLDGSEGQNS